VRAFLKMLGLGAGIHQGRSSSTDRGPFGFRAERSLTDKAVKSAGFGKSRESRKEQRLMAYSDQSG